jgi:hypothetical protein
MDKLNCCNPAPTGESIGGTINFSNHYSIAHQVMKRMQANSLPELARMADKLKSIT